MGPVYRLIAIFSVILLSCQYDTENLTKSYLVTSEGDSIYITFKKNEKNVLVNYSMLEKEIYMDIYTDSVLHYCLESKIYSVQKSNNILNGFIEGSRISRIAFSFYRGEEENLINNNLDTANRGFAVQDNSTIKREDNYSEYCNYKILNEIVDSYCLRIFDYAPLDFDTERFQKVEQDIYMSTCSYYSTEKMNLINYLKEIDIQNTKGYILVDFFTYWCGPCIQAIPKLNEMNESDIVKVVGIHPELKEKHRLEKYKNTFRCSYDLYGENAMFYYKDTKVGAYPHYVLLDALDYQIIQSWRGYQENLDGLINDAIALYEN